MEFPKKHQRLGSQPAKGADFLASARAEHVALFVGHIAKADDFVSVDEYTDALQLLAIIQIVRVAQGKWHPIASSLEILSWPSGGSSRKVWSPP